MGYEFDWRVVVEFGHLVVSGLVVTIQLSVATFLLSLPLAILIGLGRMSQWRSPRILCTAYVELFRNVPLVVQLFYWYFGVGLDAIPASIVGLTLYSSVYLGETIRSGLQSIPRTQYEAAYSTGLRTPQVVRHIILPQALMIVIPPAGTELINIVKNSSLAMTITVRELTFQTQEIDALTFRGFEAATVVTLTYLALTLAIVIVLGAIETALRVQTKVL